MEQEEKKLQAKLSRDERWTLCEFEFDDGSGVKWHLGRTTESLEKMACHFRAKGYTIEGAECNLDIPIRFLRKTRKRQGEKDDDPGVHRSASV